MTAYAEQGVNVVTVITSFTIKYNFTNLLIHTAPLQAVNHVPRLYAMFQIILAKWSALKSTWPAVHTQIVTAANNLMPFYSLFTLWNCTVTLKKIYRSLFNSLHKQKMTNFCYSNLDWVSITITQPNIQIW